MSNCLKKIRKNKKGFTLVELMVSFTLTAIFMTAAVLVMSSFLKVYYRTNNIAQSTSISDMLQETVSNELSLAGRRDTESIKISKGDDGKDSVKYMDKNGNNVELKVENGLLQLHYDAQEGIADSQPIDWGYDEKVYLGNVIQELTFTKENANVISINMTLFNEKTGYSVHSQRVIECFNLDGTDIIEVTGS